MKKIITIFFILSLFIATAYPQVTINADDMPNVGDTIRTSTSYAVTGDYSLSGANQTWDFSGLYPFTQTIDTFVSVTSTPFLYQLVFTYPSNATIAKKRPGIDTIPTVQINQVYDFFKETSSSWGYAGYAGSLNGLPIPLKYDTPEKIYKFPLTLNEKDSSVSTFAYGLTGMGYFSSWHKRVSETDGWGTLVTPYGSYATMRVKSDLYVHDSVYIDSLQLGFPIVRHIIEYHWLTDNKGLPVLQVNEEGLIVSATYIDSVRSLLSVPIINAKNKAQLYVYPNPTSKQINVEYNFDKPVCTEIELYTLSGVKITSLYSGKAEAGSFQKTFTLDNLSLESGMYIVLMKNGSDILFQKLIIE